MGFFGDLGNWIWDGIILNLILGAVAVAVLILGWGLLYLILNYVAQSEVYRGLMSSDEDNPIGVVLLCLLTPPLVIGVIGFSVGLIIASFWTVIMFFSNLIPFTMWGEKDASILIENLYYLIDIPGLLFSGSVYFAMALPLLTGLVILILAIASFGYLFPGRVNHGSIGDTNRQYAALSIAMFLALFSVILMASFSSVSTWMYEYEVDRFESDVASSDLSLEEERWYPNYTYQSAEGYETETVGDIWSTRVVSTTYGSTGILDKKVDSGAFECLSVNTMTDGLDVFLFENDPSEVENFQVKLISNQQLEISSLTSNTRSSDYHVAELTESGHEFMTMNLQEENLFRIDVGFGVGLTDETNFSFAKYHVVYAYAPDGMTNATNASIEAAASNLSNPQDCDLVAFSGALEPRFRLSSLIYVGAGVFLFGCVFHRYFVITGRDGTTDPQVLFRTFLQSQAFSIVLYSLLLFMFDPLDGTGITGLRKDWIVAMTFSAFIISILISLFVVFVIVAIVLYRQRGNIGGAVGAFMKHERELSRVEAEWFGGQ
jgi:hypothetical protein